MQLSNATHDWIENDRPTRPAVCQPASHAAAVARRTFHVPAHGLQTKKRLSNSHNLLRRLKPRRRPNEQLLSSVLARDNLDYEELPVHVIRYSATVTISSTKTF